MVGLSGGSPKLAQQSGFASAAPDWTRDVIVRIAPVRLRLFYERIDDVLFVFPEGGGVREQAAVIAPAEACRDRV